MTSDRSNEPTVAFVWVWLPGAEEPVVAGRLDRLGGFRMSQVAGCVSHAATYHLTVTQARAIVDHQVDIIRTRWADVCDRAELTSVDRSRLWERQFLNPFALYDY